MTSGTIKSFYRGTTLFTVPAHGLSLNSVKLMVMITGPAVIPYCEIFGNAARE